MSMFWRTLHCNASLASVVHSISSFQTVANAFLQWGQSTLKYNLLEAIGFRDGRFFWQVSWEHTTTLASGPQF